MQAALPSPSPYRFEITIPYPLEHCHHRLRQRWTYVHRTAFGTENFDIASWYTEVNKNSSEFYISLGSVTMKGILQRVSTTETNVTADMLPDNWWHTPRLRYPVMAILVIWFYVIFGQGYWYPVLAVPIIFGGVYLQEYIVNQYRARLVKLAQGILDDHFINDLTLKQVRR